MFSKGDRVIVTGDAGHAAHHFPAGTHGKVVDVGGGVIRVEPDDTGMRRWVYPQDLQPEDAAVACTCCGVR